jgi:excisionase family DNA binding protein
MAARDSDDESSEELMSAAEAADYLKVSRMTIVRWCHSDTLPAFKIDGEWRIHRRVVEERAEEPDWYDG